MSSDESDNDGDGYTLEEYDLPDAHHVYVSQDQHQDAEDSNDVYGNLDVRMSAMMSGNSGQQQPPSGMRMQQPHQQSSQTGSKGVRQDYQRSKYHLQNTKMRESMRTEKELNRQAGIDRGVTQATVDHIYQQVQQQKKQNGVEEESKQQPQSDSDLDDDEAELLQLQQQRMSTLQASLPTFGTYNRVLSMADFSSCVKSLHPAVYCITHIYENHLPVCTRLNLVLESLAQQFQHVCFLRIRSADMFTGKKYNEVGLPTVIVYKNGDMVENAVRFSDALPDKGQSTFTDYDVAAVLATKGILKLPTGEKEVQQWRQREEKVQQQRQRFRISTQQGYDSDD